MREYFYTFPEIGKGLRNGRKSHGLVRCYNLKANGDELLDISVPSGTFASSTWPLPTLTAAGSELFLGTDAGLFEVDPTSYALTSIVAHAGTSYWIFNTVPGFLLANAGGEALYLYNLKAGTYSLLTSLANPASTIPSMLDACWYKGRLIGIPNSSWYDCDGTYVVWSKFGNIDFELDESNVAGYAPLRSGTLVRVLSLADYCLLYGSLGISAVRSSGQYLELSKLSNHTLASKHSIVSTSKGHFFLNSRGQLVYVSRTLEVQEMDYSEYFSPIAFDAVLSYDEDKQELYVSSSTKSYLLTRYGLSEVWFSPTSLVNYEGSLLGPSVSVGTQKVYVETEMTTLGNPARKLVTLVDFDLVSDNDGYGYIRLGTSYSSEQESTSSVELNPEGAAVIFVDAYRIGLGLEVAGPATSLNGITARYKYSDVRALRGMPANASAANS